MRISRLCAANGRAKSGNLVSRTTILLHHESRRWRASFASECRQSKASRQRQTKMKIGSTLQRLRSSIVNSAGTIVFGMEDGTVSIFGLIFGVAATTTSTATVLIAGASGAVAAAVSMMAGAYLDVETTRDKIAAKRASLRGDVDLDAACAALPPRLAAAGLT